MICFPTKVYEFLRSNARDRPDTQIFKLLLKLFAEDCKVDYTKAEMKDALRQYQPNYLTQQETRALIQLCQGPSNFTGMLYSIIQRLFDTVTKYIQVQTSFKSLDQVFSS